MLWRTADLCTAGMKVVSVQSTEECQRLSQRYWRMARLVTHEACRTVNTDLRCPEISFHHLQTCFDPEGGDCNLRRNVGNYLPFGTEFIPLDLNCHENFPQAVEIFPAFYLKNQVCCAHNSLPQGTILRPMSPVPNLSVYFFKVHFNIIILPMLKSSKYSHPFKYVDKNVCIHLLYLLPLHIFSASHMRRPFIRTNNIQ